MDATRDDRSLGASKRGARLRSASGGDRPVGGDRRGRQFGNDQQRDLGMERHRRGRRRRRPLRRRARYGASGVWDPVRQRVVIFGGDTATSSSTRSTTMRGPPGRCARASARRPGRATAPPSPLMWGGHGW